MDSMIDPMLLKAAVDWGFDRKGKNDDDRERRARNNLTMVNFHLASKSSLAPL